MARCPDCGVSLWFSQTKGGGEVISLEEREEMSGEGRYIEVGLNRVRELGPDESVRGYVDHKLWCSAKGGYAVGR